MKLTVLGCGDAFGSGGRLQTCFHLATPGGATLIDCGATALIAMNRLALAPNDISTIVISHLHGDHFSGLVWWMLHAQHIAKRRTPLTLVGPAGLEQRLAAAMEALFPASTAVPPKFELRFVKLSTATAVTVNRLSIGAFEVSHPSGDLSAGLRISTEGRTVAFSGDTEWVEALVDVAADADLFITECYSYETTARYHIEWPRLRANLDRLTARRILISHMSAEMLANRHLIDEPRVLFAEDGLELEV